MDQVVFVHAADLHLGTPFKGLGRTSSWLRERLVWANFQALKNLVDLAREADFLLLAGDILETGLPHLRARLEFVKAMRLLSREGVRVFMVAGNHDPYTFWKEVELPEGVHLFSPQGGVERLVLGDVKVAVSGVSHGDRSVRENLVHRIKPGRADLRLALVHAYLQGQEGHDPYAPCSLGDLVSRNFHYWALGHIHRAQVVMEDPWVVYPGNLQGRHPREAGGKGCYRGIWDGGVLKVEFCPLSPVVWEDVSLTVEGLENTEALLELLERVKEEKRWQGGTLLRVRLEGPSPLYFLGEEDWRQLEEVLNAHEDREDFLWVTLEDRLSPPLDLGSLEAREDFLAQLVEESRRLKGDLAVLVEEGELATLWKRREVVRWLGPFSLQEGEGLVDRALKRVLTFLLEEK